MRLRDLTQPEPIFQLLHPDLALGFPPLRSLDTLPNILPQPVTSFIGREKGSEDIKHLLSQARLLTLVGSGGAGKSRSSVQVAADMLDLYPDGVWLAEPAPLSEGALAAQEVARVLGIPEEPGASSSQSLARVIAPKTLLLLLDNCEHLIEACADLAALLLRACPHVRILASSREALHVGGEQVYLVPSLPSGEAATVEFPARSKCARLFVDRASLRQPGFAITPANARAAAGICTRLDGISLAIELGAARVGALTVEEINSRLDNCFRLLSGGSRTRLPRQQTLRALIDWSYSLLDDDERRTPLCARALLCISTGTTGLAWCPPWTAWPRSPSRRTLPGGPCVCWVRARRCIKLWAFRSRPPTKRSLTPCRRRLRNCCLPLDTRFAGSRAGRCLWRTRLLTRRASMTAIDIPFTGN